MYFVLEQVLKRGVDWWDRKAGGMVEAVPRRSGVQKAIQYTLHGVTNQTVCSRKCTSVCIPEQCDTVTYLSRVLLLMGIKDLA